VNNKKKKRENGGGRKRALWQSAKQEAPLPLFKYHSKFWRPVSRSIQVYDFAAGVIESTHRCCGKLGIPRRSPLKPVKVRGESKIGDHSDNYRVNYKIFRDAQLFAYSALRSLSEFWMILAMQHPIRKLENI
jgi:hypothetical protein